MYWLFLLLALGAFVLALLTTQTWVLALALLAALLFLLLWIKGLYSARFGAVNTQAPRPLHPDELQAMRRQLQQADATAPASPAPPPESQ